MLSASHRFFGYRSGLLAMLCLIVSNAPGAKDNTNAPLKTVLNTKGYILGSPATNWPYPGGFIVALGKSANFIDLPSSVPKPTPQPGSADFPAEKKTGGFTLSAILTGMTALIGGDPGGGFGHASTLTFQELKAQGSRITYEQASNILKNSDVKADVTQWLATPKQQVFIIAEILTTNDISVSSTSTWNGDLAFDGKIVCKCGDNSSSSTNDSAKSQSTPSSPPTPAADHSSTSTPTMPAKPTQDSKNSTPSSPSVPATTSPGASSPGGELHWCSNNNNVISMKTDTPLVFAAGAYKITKGSGQTLELQPVFVPTSGGTMAEDNLAKRNLAASQRAAAAIPTAWKRKPWPAAK